MSGTNKRTLRDDHGAAAVEFALVSILLVMLIVGMFEIGRLFMAQAALTHAAREGAREAAVGKFNDAYVLTQAKTGPLADRTVTITQSYGTDALGTTFVRVELTSSISIAPVDINWLRTATTIPLSAAAQMRAEVEP